MFLFGPPNVKKLEAKRNLNGLIKALSYKKDNSVREAAAEALEKLGWQPSTTEDEIFYWAAKGNSSK